MSQLEKEIVYVFNDVIYDTYEMNIKTNLIAEYVNFVDNTKKQNKYFKIIIFLNVIIKFLFLFLVFLSILQSNVRTSKTIQV